MIKLMGITESKRGGAWFLRLMTQHPGGIIDSFVLQHPVTINHGFLVSNLIQHYGVTPDRILIPIHIEAQLPIHR